MIYSEMIARAVQLGLVPGRDPAMSEGELQMTAEAAYPHAVRAVFRIHARSGRNVENLAYEHLIEIVNGEGTLPEALLREYLDRSHLPRVNFSSLIPYEDYRRYRFDAQMSYYSPSGPKLYYSGDVPAILGEVEDATASNNSITVTGDASAFAVGDRFRVLDGSTLVIDALIASINGSTDFTCRGKTLAALASAANGTVYDVSDDELLREVTDLVTNTASANVTSATAAFTAADVGRRLRAYQTGTETVVVDSIITALVDTDEVTLGAKPVSTEAACDAGIFYSPLILQAPGIPSVTDAAETLELTLGIAEDTILKIASVLRGEMPLDALIKEGNGER